MENLYRWKIEGAWNGASDIERIKKIVSRTSMCVTRYAYTNQGMFYKETVFRKGDKSISYPRKDVAPYNLKDENGLYKYGGYSNVQRAYFVALEYTDGKKQKKVILGVPVMTEYQAKGDPEKIKEYFESVEGLKDVKILIPKIKMDALISYNGYKGYLTGESSGCIKLSNAIQWFSRMETDLYVKGIDKLLSMVKDGKLKNGEYESEEFEIHTNRYKEKMVIVNRKNNEQLYEDILKQISLRIYQHVSKLQKLKSVLEDKKKIFDSKSVLEQAKVLLNLVVYLRRANSHGVDLTSIGASSGAGDLRFSSDITKVAFSIIHQSPCGLVERIQKI